ncbi:MAG: hypothetical protein AB4041_16270 [Microcystaceae cyanobacterium]
MIVKNEILANVDKLPEALQIELLHYSDSSTCYCSFGGSLRE